MKKLWIVIIGILILPINVFGIDFDTYSDKVLLYEVNDDLVLYEKNSNVKGSIASITKVMTAIVCLENIDNLDDKVTLINSDFYGLVEANASVAGFYVGEVVTYRDLLCGLLLPSGADAAQALARIVAGSGEEFVNMMNLKAKELGMNDTSFANMTGLDDENNYSTLNDVYKMFKYAVENEEFLNIIKLDSYTTSNSKHKFTSTIKKMFDNYDIDNMDYLIGGKTGSTGDAGLCLASYAEYDGVFYILITTGAPFLRDKPYTLLDAKKIYEHFMNNYSYVDIVNKGDVVAKIETLYGVDDYVSVKSNYDVSKYLEKTVSKDDLEYVYDGVNLVTRNMNVGDVLGNVSIKLNGEVLDTIEVRLDKKIEFSLYKYLSIHKWIVLVAILVLFSIIGGIVLMFKRKR